MSLRRRVPATLLLLGALATVLAVPALVVYGKSLAIELPWIAAMLLFLGAAAYTRRRLPEHPSAGWFASAAGLSVTIQAIDGVIWFGVDRGWDGAAFAWVVLVQHLLLVITVVCLAHLIGLFPEGVTQRRAEKRVLGGLWALTGLPVLLFFSHPTVVFFPYLELPETTNPYALDALAPLGGIAAVAVVASQGAFVVGLVPLAHRYRRATREVRQQIRWLMVPALLVVLALAFDLLVGSTAVFLMALWIPALVMFPVSIAIALLKPDLLDVDVVLRKSLVYGFLWLLIAGAYVAAAAGLGVVAGQRFSVGVAIALAVAATVVFQPARQRLERLADRWVFGARTDPTRLISRLGAALEETVELESLLPRMADALQEGLGLRWARVRLEPVSPVGDEEPTLSVPIVLDGVRLGVVECGPKRAGVISDADEAVVTTLARQAALAVRNVRLTAELEHSRARLVRAQEVERRRIERNIHDGVQQDLVALIGHTAHVRSELRRDPASGEAALDDLQRGLRRVIGELRELAQGIHPSVLSDRGLLEAVEALASRSTVPVSVRADPALRGLRFAEEVEGAGYFTVAEALANVSKHAAATEAQVNLSQANGSLRIEVRDDGIGFDPATAPGGGLANLAERLSALGGRLDVTSRPGGGTTVTASLRVGDG